MLKSTFASALRLNQIITQILKIDPVLILLDVLYDHDQIEVVKSCLCLTKMHYDVTVSISFSKTATQKDNCGVYWLLCFQTVRFRSWPKIQTRSVPSPLKDFRTITLRRCAANSVL